MKKQNDIYYISGKITGCDLREAQKKFFNAEGEIMDKFPNSGFVNPMGTYLGPNVSWYRYMEVDLELLEKYANAIYILSDYRESKGAILELERAKELGYKIEYQ